MQRSILPVFVTGALVAAACTSGDDADTAPATTLAPITTADGETDADEPEPVDEPGSEAEDSTSTEPTAATLPEASDIGELRAGVEQLTLTGASPGSVVHALPDDDETLLAFLDLASSSGSEPPDGVVVDAEGSLLLRGLTPGAPLRLVIDGSEVSEPVTPLGRDEHPDAAFFAEQRLPSPGFGYIETRDGTTLSANVVLPGPVEDGPYPTVVEYSGYTPSDPEAAGFKDLFAGLGYAYVGVNMRGTGCSGGSFRFFEYTQSTDGYDVIEAVAAQPWVQGDRVGMVGVSYPGISQLFVAQTRPPSLAAITPLSVLDDSYRSTLYPGGILNTGFAVEWTQQRQDDALPAPDGQGWAADRIAEGDEECEANQAVRLQNPDLVTEIRDNPFYTSDLGDELAPELFVDRIEVPTFVAGAWQDEQTGGRFPSMLDRFTGTDHLYASLTNGLHTDSISPAVFQRFLEFLDLYVAERTPTMQVANLLTPLLAGGLYGTTDFPAFEDRFAGLEHAEALAAFEAEPPIELLFENGAADGLAPLTPGARFVVGVDAWPVPGTEARRWFLDATGDGALVETAPSIESTADYVAEPPAVPTFWTGNSSDLWRTDVVWEWIDDPAEQSATFTSAPLSEDLVMAGTGSIDLFVDTDAEDTDIEVTLTEILPDGSEVYVQSGWLRASHRLVDEEHSSELRPVHSHLQADAAPLNASGEYDLVRVELFPFAHVFRSGSQLRVSVDAPGGNRAVWEFETIADGEIVTLGTGGTIASSIVLPIIPGVDAPAGAPGCGSLRGQPCRPG